MTDDKSKTGWQDRVKINTNETYEMDYASKHLGVSKELILKAVAAVGNGRQHVEDWLRRNGHIR